MEKELKILPGEYLDDVVNLLVTEGKEKNVYCYFNNYRLSSREIKTLDDAYKLIFNCTKAAFEFKLKKENQTLKKLYNSKKIEVLPGDYLDNIVNKLLEEKDPSYCIFSGYILSNEYIKSLDDAYLLLFNCTKEEFEYNRNIEMNKLKKKYRHI